MGFRSTFTMTDYPYRWPDWFRAKYGGSVHVPGQGALSSKGENKLYGVWSELPEDIRKAIDWDHYDGPDAKAGDAHAHKAVVVFLHECGGITRVEITRATVRANEPSGWKNVEGSGHSYCYGCSDCGGGPGG